MAEAEVGGLDDDEDSDGGLDEEKLKDEGAKADREGLTDFANLDLFIAMLELGTFEHGLSYTELTQMPASRYKDLRFLLGRYSKKKKKARKEKERMNKTSGKSDD